MNGALEVVRVGTYGHTAWAEFYRSNKIYNFIPDRMTVYADWPPTDYPNLNLFARRLEEFRFRIDTSEMDILEKRTKHELPSNIEPYHIGRVKFPYADIPRQHAA